MSNILKTLILALSLTLAACIQTPAQPAQTPLRNTDWTLTRLNNQATTAAKPAQLRLDAEGRFSGFGGCNRFTGAYQLTDGQMAFSQIASTKMACIGDAMTREDAFFKALAHVTSWEIKGQTLSLRDAGGKVVLELEAAATRE